MTAEAQSAITLLQERRTALISAAVTGKIRRPLPRLVTASEFTEFLSLSLRVPPPRASLQTGVD